MAAMKIKWRRRSWEYEKLGEPFNPPNESLDDFGEEFYQVSTMLETILLKYGRNHSGFDADHYFFDEDHYFAPSVGRSRRIGAEILNQNMLTVSFFKDMKNRTRMGRGG